MFRVTYEASDLLLVQLLKSTKDGLGGEYWLVPMVGEAGELGIQIGGGSEPGEKDKNEEVGKNVIGSQ